MENLDSIKKEILDKITESADRGAETRFQDLSMMSDTDLAESRDRFSLLAIGGDIKSAHRAGFIEAVMAHRRISKRG